MPKPTQADLDQLAESLRRAKEIYRDGPGHALENCARALGYLEMAVERFLEANRPQRRKAVQRA